MSNVLSHAMQSMRENFDYFISQPTQYAAKQLNPIHTEGLRESDSAWYGFIPQQAGDRPDTVALPERGSSAGAFSFLVEDKKEFDDVWRFHADPGNDAPTVTSASALRSALGVNSRWEGAEQVKALIDHLDEKGLLNSRILTDLKRIKTRESLWTLNNIAQKLKDFHSAGNCARGVDSDELVANAIHDVAWPSDIAQRDYGTCAAAALQMKMALERPSQYTTTLLSLAKGQNVRTAGGAIMKPNNSWQGQTDVRTLSARIMQNAIMNLGGHGVLWNDTYNSGNDDNENGLNRSQQTYALEELFGNSDYDNDDLFSSSASLVNYVEDELARGRSAIVSFEGHAVLVVGLDKRGSTDKFIINSWGKQFEMTRSEFKQHIKATRTLNNSGWDDHKTPNGRLTLIQ